MYLGNLIQKKLYRIKIECLWLFLRIHKKNPDMTIYRKSCTKSREAPMWSCFLLIFIAISLQIIKFSISVQNSTEIFLIKSIIL